MSFSCTVVSLGLQPYCVEYVRQKTDAVAGVVGPLVQGEGRHSNCGADLV